MLSLIFKFSLASVLLQTEFDQVQCTSFGMSFHCLQVALFLHEIEHNTPAPQGFRKVQEVCIPLFPFEMLLLLYGSYIF